MTEARGLLEVLQIRMCVVARVGVHYPAAWGNINLEASWKNHLSEGCRVSPLATLALC